MKPESIYRTSGGREEVLGLYDREVDRMGSEVESRSVETRFGHTHLLTLGPAAAPPLVVFQGGNFLGPLTLNWFRPLAEEWRLYAPDTVGHPGKSSETRLSPSDASYGEWALDVLDHLGLDRVPVLGLSYGAGITLRLAGIAPERIQKMALVMPAGIISPPVAPLLTRIVPWLVLYRLLPTRKVLMRAAEPLFTDTPQEAWLDVLGAVFRNVKLERGMPRPTDREELRDLNASVLVLAGDEDPFFPGVAVVRRAREVVPNLSEAEAIDGCSHLLGGEPLGYVNSKLQRFFSSSP